MLRTHIAGMGLLLRGWEGGKGKGGETIKEGRGKGEKEMCSFTTCNTITVVKLLKSILLSNLTTVILYNHCRYRSLTD